MTDARKTAWDAYVQEERERFAALFREHGVALAEDQPHLSGERYLMAGQKLVLMGNIRGKRAVIKVSTKEAGRSEIIREREVRAQVNHLPFSYRLFKVPEELLFINTPSHTLAASAYIPQECSFLERSIEAQARFALEGFSIQEAVHATTGGHFRRIRHVFATYEYETYYATLKEMARGFTERDGKVAELAEKSVRAWQGQEETVSRYCGFMTHGDFVPHNMRIKDDTLYLLDWTSLHFGNKHESWARFINFMELYNPPLAQALVEYIRNNRALEELESLKLMRVYKLVFLLLFYEKAKRGAEGPTRALAQARIALWSHILASVLGGHPVDARIIADYKSVRASLRSPDEQQRQVSLH